MKRRQIIGWLVIAVGIVLIMIALHSMHEFAKDKGLSTDVKYFFTQNPLWNPIIEFFGGKPQEKPPEHNLPAIITQIIGIIFVIVGGVAAFVFRRKK